MISYEEELLEATTIDGQPMMELTAGELKREGFRLLRTDYVQRLGDMAYAQAQAAKEFGDTVASDDYHSSADFLVHIETQPFSSSGIDIGQPLPKINEL